MSIHSEIPRLNFFGQIVLGGISGVLVNAIAHPISTCQAHLMTSSSVPRMGLFALYRGYPPICATDAGAFATAYLVNDALQDRLPKLPASIAAGLISAPVICFGEGLTRNRQVNAMPYAEIFQRALRPAGLTTTALREVPFTIAVFCSSPMLQSWITQQLPSNRPVCSDTAVQIFAGMIAGAAAGLATSPIDLVKTRVQTNDASLTIRQVVRAVLTEEGFRGFFRGGGMRSLYVGLAGAGMNVIKNTAPHFLPSALRTETE